MSGGTRGPSSESLRKKRAGNVVVGQQQFKLLQCFYGSGRRATTQQHFVALE